MSIYITKNNQLIESQIKSINNLFSKSQFLKSSKRKDLTNNYINLTKRIS